jgi:hypothetical protein
MASREAMGPPACVKFDMLRTIVRSLPNVRTLVPLYRKALLMPHRSPAPVTGSVLALVAVLSSGAMLRIGGDARSQVDAGDPTAGADQARGAKPAPTRAERRASRRQAAAEARWFADTVGTT